MDDDPFNRLTISTAILGSENARRLHGGLGAPHARGALDPAFAAAFEADILKIFDRMEQSARRISHISFRGGDPRTKAHIQPSATSWNGGPGPPLDAALTGTSYYFRYSR